MLGACGVFFWLNAVAAHTCSDTYGTMSRTDGAGGGVPRGTMVYHVDTNTADNLARYRCCLGANNCGSANKYFRITTNCSGGSENTCYDGTNAYTTWGSGDGSDNLKFDFHLEYRGSCEFACVPTNVNGDNCSDLDISFDYESGWNYGLVPSNFTKNNQTGKMYYGDKTANGTSVVYPSGYTKYCDEKGCFAWNTKGCKLTKTHNTGRCLSGTVNWPADQKSISNAYYGFKVRYNKSDISYTCNTCDKGWTKDSSTDDKCGCNTAGHWDCPSSGDARCYPGYQQNGSGSSATCTQKPHYECPIELNTNQNTCVCKFGFTGDDCNECRENFQLVEDTSNHENDRCLCPYGYIKYGESTTDNPNDDRCVLNTSQVYVDQTGWFTLSSDGSNMCETNWWVQENNN